MINVGYGVFNTAGGGGGFTPAYYTPTSYTGGWANPENAYDGSGVATGTQSTLDMSSTSPGSLTEDESSVDETYSFASTTGFSQIVIAGTYDYDLTSDAIQYTSGSEDPFYQGYRTGIAQFLVQISVDGGSTYATIELKNCPTLPPGNAPSGQNLTGTTQPFNSTINSASAIALPANLNLLKIRLRSFVTAQAYRANDGGSPNTLYAASGVSQNSVYNMTVYVS
jgi:hypothetical protein